MESHGSTNVARIENPGGQTVYPDVVQPGEWLRVLTLLANEADAIALRYFRASDLHVTSKPDRSWVSQADLEIESTVRDILVREHPGVGVFGEELGAEAGRGAVRLIIDPIDATANFVRGIPIFATLLAIEDGDTIVAGLVSAPALGQRWSAARGGGAWCGDRRIRVSGVESLADAQVFHGSLAGIEAVPQTARIPSLLAMTRRQRGLGDFYQHALVAEGCGEIAVDPIAQPWDVAPLVVLVEEAGGRATTLEGSRSIYEGSFVSSNGLLHETALSAFR